jgi:hypothetical protein
VLSSKAFVCVRFIVDHVQVLDFLPNRFFCARFFPPPRTADGASESAGVAALVTSALPCFESRQRGNSSVHAVLTHCGLWEDPEAAERPPPAPADGMAAGDLSYEPDPDFVPFADDPADDFSE